MADIGLIDADLMDNGTRFPNLSLMKLSGYYKEQGHNVELIDYDQIPSFDKVFLSKVFTFTEVPINLDFYSNIEYGGTGYNYNKEDFLADEIEHHEPDYELYQDHHTESKYYSNHSIGFTTRFCFRQCPFCVNRNKKKSIRWSKIEEFDREENDYIVLLDDNVLAHPDRIEILNKLFNIDKPYEFNQGLDFRLMNNETAYILNNSRYNDHFHFAFDNINDKEEIIESFKVWRKYNDKVNMFYVLTGYDYNQEYDYDFCVTGIRQEKFEKLFPKAKLVGKDFPVYLLNGNEIAFARTERKTAKGHKGFEVKFNPDVTIEEDLERRDLTINSMAYNIWKDKIIDPFNGQNDIKNNILRATSKAFSEDPLRVYRTARFAAQLDFEIDNPTLFMMNELRKELYDLPTERVFKELRKVMNSDNPSIFFEKLFLSRTIDIHFEELNNLYYVPQVKKYHPEVFAHKHTLQSLKVITKLTEKEHVRFAVLMHDIGKGLTPKENLPHHYKHSKLGLDALDNFNKRILIPNKWYKTAKLVIKEHMRITNWQEMRYGKLVRLFKRIKKSPITIEDMVKVVKADKLGRNNKHKQIDCMDGICKLYYKLFNKTGGKDIDSNRYSGKKFGEQLFQYRCHWIKRERNKILKE